jgi:hypothetical protein
VHTTLASATPSEVVLERHHRLPTMFDPEQVLQYVEARQAVAADNLVDLQEDPAYFANAVTKSDHYLCGMHHADRNNTTNP